ncbi:MAG TPA: SAM-dependent methyltransferase [Actinoplanes sp.]
MPDRPAWVSADIDVSRPSNARVYDYFLGGAHNFEVDRQLAEQIVRMTPNVGETMRANRVFLRRAVRYLVDQGIRQFLDIGSGIPTVGNVHEIAQRAAPGSRVVYVDIDPVAVAHSRTILQGDPGTAVLCGDLRKPADILVRTREIGLLDFDEPIAVLLAGVVHFLPDSCDPGGIIAQLRDAVCPGSYLLLSHVTGDGQPPEMLAAYELSDRTDSALRLRARAELERYFAGLTMVEPGLVFITTWRPDPGDEPDDDPQRLAAYAGVGRKD